MALWLAMKGDVTLSKNAAACWLPVGGGGEKSITPVDRFQ